MPDISRLRSGNFYVAIEGEAFLRIVAPWCLSYHPASPPSAEEVLGLARGSSDCTFWPSAEWYQSGIMPAWV